MPTTRACSPICVARSHWRFCAAYDQAVTLNTFFVNLSGASSNALIGVAQGIGTILDDDNHGK